MLIIAQAHEPLADHAEQRETKSWNLNDEEYVDSRVAHLGKGKAMLTDRLQANRLLAITGFTFCFLFLLAVIVLAFG